MSTIDPPLQTLSKDVTPLCQSLADILLKKYAIYTGGYDREFRQLIVFQDVGSTSLPSNTYRLLMHYFSTLPPLHSSVQEFTVVIDRRTGDWNSVKLIVNKLNEEFHVNVSHILVLKPQGWLQTIGVDKTSSLLQKSSKVPICFLNKAEELLRFIDKDNLTKELSGDLDFDIEDWITNRIIRQKLYYIIGKHDCRIPNHKIENFSSKVQHLCVKLHRIQTNHSVVESIQLFGDNIECVECDTDVSSFIDDSDCIKSSKELAASLADSDLETLQLNKFFAYPFLSNWTKQLRHWLDTIEEFEMEGLDIRKQLHTPIVGVEKEELSDLNMPLSNENENSHVIDLPVDYVHHIIALDRVIINLTEARVQFRCYWRQYIQYVHLVNRITKVELQYKEFLPLSSMWDNLIESVQDYLPTKCSKTIPSMYRSASHSSVKCLTTHQEDDNNNSTGDNMNKGNIVESNSCGDWLSQIDTCKEADPLFRKSIMESLETLSCCIIEAESASGRLISRFRRLRNITKMMTTHIVTEPKYANNTEETNAGIIVLDESVLLDLISQFNKFDQIGVNNCASNENQLICESQTFVNNEDDDVCNSSNSSIAITTDYAGDSDESRSNVTENHYQQQQQSLAVCNEDYVKQFHYPALQLPSSLVNWFQMFDHLYKLASKELPKAADQVKRLLQLYKEIDSAVSWIKEGELLMEIISPVSNLDSMDLSECRSHLDKLITFVNSRETLLKFLRNPKLFHLKVAGLLDADLKTQLTRLLFNVEDLAERCNHGVALLRQHISRISFSQTIQSSTSSTQSITSTDQKDSVQRGSIQDVSSEIANVPNLAESVSSPNTTDVAVSGTLSAPRSSYYLVWRELINTERNYVNFLQHIYDVLWLTSFSESKFPFPKFMCDSQYRLLVNWPELLCFHRDTLLPALEACEVNAKKLEQCVSFVVPRLVDLYSVYSAVYENTIQLAVHIERDRDYSKWINACNEEINRRELKSSSTDHISNQDHDSSAQSNNQSKAIPAILPFSSKLVIPVQRFQRYHLLFERLAKEDMNESDRVYLQAAHKALLETCQTVNVTMLLRGLSSRPSELGKLLLQSDFTVSRDDLRFTSNKQRRVFLFTTALLLTKYRPIYPNNSMSNTMSNLLKDQSSDSSDRFHLLNYTNPNEHVNSSSTGQQHHHHQQQQQESNDGHPKRLTKPISIGKNMGISYSNNSLSNYILMNNQSGPAYEVKQQLLLKQIGLTPGVREDRRRFAIWTANRAHTYVFHSTETVTRDKWVKAINNLLTDQLFRIQHHNDPTVQDRVTNNNKNNNNKNNKNNKNNSNKEIKRSNLASEIISDRSRSLPIAHQPQQKSNKKGSVTSLPFLSNLPPIPNTRTLD